MKRFVFALAIILNFVAIAPVYGQASSATPLLWTQTNATLTEAQNFTYKIYSDVNPTGVVLTGVTCTAAGTPLVITCQAPFPAFTPGSHTLQLTATNAAGESARSSVFGFTFVVVPSAPSSIRIGSPVSPSSSPVRK